MLSPFQIVTLRAAALALVLARRCPTREERAMRLARVVRYCRARGLRGPSSSSRARVMAARIEEEWRSADRD